MMNFRRTTTAAAVTIILCAAALSACSSTTESNEAIQAQAEVKKPTPAPALPVPAPSEKAQGVSALEQPAPALAIPTKEGVEIEQEPVESKATVPVAAPATKATTASSATYRPSNAGPRIPITDEFKAYSWYYMKQPKGYVPNFPNEIRQFTDNMKALWVGTGKKVYLTIDTGGSDGGYRASSQIVEG